MNKIKDRLLKVAEYHKLSIRKFEEYCSLNRGNISNIAEDGNIGSDKLSKILDSCGDINSHWLITGKGEMLTDTPSTKKVASINNNVLDLETRPRIPLNVAAGTLSTCLDGVTLCQCEQLPVIHAFPRYDFTIMVRGESMEPEYRSGDELAGLYIKNTSFVQWGCAHILDTAQGIIVKNIYDDDECIICRSENPRFSEFSIHKSEVYNIALVIGLIRRY